MMTSTVHIVLNGEPRELVADSVRDLLEALGVDASRPGVAVALNDRVVRRALWESTRIVDGDRVEVITAMQGG
ncbi:MAG TPA: sulfur carrier protein ThiS [Candidatus Kapabacteria bacterium]|nr:sulfur carrier protein ThiS [Candidatus Kapabacteria bacterium]